MAKLQNKKRRAPSSGPSRRKVKRSLKPDPKATERQRIVNVVRTSIDVDGLWPIPAGADTSGISLLQDDLHRLYLVRTDIAGFVQPYQLLGSDLGPLWVVELAGPQPKGKNFRTEMTDLIVNAAIIASGMSPAAVRKRAAGAVEKGKPARTHVGRLARPER